MKRIPTIHLFISALTLAAISAAFAQAPAAPAARPPITLKVGDAAPPFKVAKWIKGAPTTDLRDGTVHVIEFWATWCGPCKSSMPHLSELAERFKGKASFISVNVWESQGAGRDYAADVEKAAKFVGYAGDMMDYTVAMDTVDDEMAKTWMTAAGQNGIPASYIVDGKGTILWIGHPQVGLEEAVEQAVEGKLTVESGKKIKEDSRAKFNEFYAAMKTHADQLKAKDYDGAVATAEKVAASLPSITEHVQMKLDALVWKDRQAARAFAGKSARANHRAPYLLLGMARTLLDDKIPGSDESDAKLGLRLVTMAAEKFGPDDLGVLSASVQAHARSGQKDKAVAAQERYVKLLSNPSLKAPAAMIEQAKTRLEELKALK